MSSLVLAYLLLGALCSTADGARVHSRGPSPCDVAFQDIRAKDDQLRAKDEQIHALDEDNHAKDDQLRMKDEQIRALEIENLRLTKTTWAESNAPMPLVKTVLAPRGPNAEKLLSENGDLGQSDPDVCKTEDAVNTLRKVIAANNEVISSGTSGNRTENAQQQSEQETEGEKEEKKVTLSYHHASP